MHAPTPAQAQVLRALRAGSRVTLRMQTGRIQQVLRGMAELGLVKVGPDGVVSLAHV